MMEREPDREIVEQRLTFDAKVPVRNPMLRYDEAHEEIAQRGERWTPQIITGTIPNAIQEIVHTGL